MSSRISHSRLVMVAGVLGLAATACVGPREGAAPDSAVGPVTKNGSNVLGADSFDDFTGALSMTTDLIKSDAKGWDLEKELEDNKCTPANRKGELIHSSLAGCVYSDPTTPWIDYSKMKDKTDRTNAVKTDLRNWYYQLAKWPRNFSKHDLNGVTFRNIDLSYFQKMADPQYQAKTVGENARFAGAIFAGATFDNVRVSGSFIAADFRNFRVKSLGDLSTTRLEGANFTSADLSYMKLPYSLIGTDFTKADMRGVTIVDGLITSAKFDEANLSGASIQKATIGGQWGISSELLDQKPGLAPSVTSMRGTNLSFANLSNSNLSRIDFTGANLTGANLSNTDLTGAKFIGANLAGANLSGAKFGCAIACGKSNQELTKFDGSTLNGANFSGTSGTDVRFVGVAASAANFSRVAFTRADFSNADVSGSSFVSARIDGAKFANAIGKCTDNGYCTDFTGANLMSSDRSGFPSEFARYTGGVYLDRDADFSNANFTKTNLNGVYFEGKFTSAVVVCSTFIDANITYWAKFDGATFAGIDFSKTKFQSRTAPASTPIDCNGTTSLPSGYPVATPTTALVAPVTTLPTTTLPSFAVNTTVPRTTVPPTTVPRTTVPPTTVAPTTTLPATVAVLPGGKCPAGYVLAASKTKLFSFVCARSGR